MSWVLPKIKRSYNWIVLCAFPLIVVLHGMWTGAEGEKLSYLRFAGISSQCMVSFCGLCFLLCLRKKRRSFKVFSLLMAMVFLASLMTMVRAMSLGSTIFFHTRILNPWILIYGNIYGVLFGLYSIELIRPNYLTFRRIMRLFAIAVLPLLLYVFCVGKGWIEQRVCYSISDIFEHPFEFSVIYRCLGSLFPVGIASWILWMKLRFLKSREAQTFLINSFYIRWANNALFGFILIATSYYITLTNNGQSSGVIHGFVIFTYMVCFLGLELFRDYNIETKMSSSLITPEDPAQMHNDAFSRHLFSASSSSRVARYRQQIDTWMLVEKPYLNPSFMLKDVMEVIPLNRSYLSRFFNDVYGKTFPEFIMSHRLAESKRLLLEEPDCTIAQILERCGFSSPSVFGRAFQKHEGMTPLHYRRSQGVNAPKDQRIA